MSSNLDMKENSVKNYIDSIDFNREEWTYEKLLEELRSICGEAPGVDIEWGKDAMILEGENEAKEIQYVSQVSVVFSDGGYPEPEFRKVTIDVDKRFKK